jgi:hypothetical protein
VIDAPPTTAWYVYGVVRADDPALEDAVGSARTTVGGRGSVVLLGHAGLAAVTSEVDVAEFGDDVIAQHLNDRAWVEEKALAHEAVLERIASTTSVVPLRFGTIYRSADDVLAMIEERRDALEADLERVHGRCEVGLKLWLVSSPSAASTPSGAESGRAYLERRRTEQERARASKEHAVEAARSLHARLLELAADGVANRPQPPELTGRDEPMILNAAYLVDRDGVGALEATVQAAGDELARAGLAPELTGPWPPHNFVGRSAGADDER